MTHRAWSELVSAYEDASRLIAGALASPGERPDLDTLRGRLRRRLDDLLTELSPPLPPEEAAEMLVPLVFLLDEQVEGLLARGRHTADFSLEWPLLQRDLFPDGDGGDAFYERAAALLRQPAPSPLVLGAYLFCLQAGFQGRLVDNPTATPEWKARLAERLPVLPPAPPATPPPASLRARSRTFYVLAALGALVALQIVLAIVARAVPMTPVRPPAAALTTAGPEAAHPAGAEHSPAAPVAPARPARSGEGTTTAQRRDPPQASPSEPPSAPPGGPPPSRAERGARRPAAAPAAHPPRTKKKVKGAGKKKRRHGAKHEAPERPKHRPRKAR